MTSVTQRIKEIKQPRGGYIKPSAFKTIELEDDKTLNLNENIHPTLVGLVVDYMTRCVMGSSIRDAFAVSIQGAITCSAHQHNKNAWNEIKFYLEGINGLDDQSIINACKAASFDVWYRNTPAAFQSKPAKAISPDKETIENIRIMINRSIDFWKEYGPITKDGFTFERKGYTKTVSTGDGDFLTKDTLWDFKVSKEKPTSKHTLQLLMYWIMGQHSGQDFFKTIDKLGIFNPRLNVVYIYDLNQLDKETIQEVEEKVICY